MPAIKLLDCAKPCMAMGVQSWSALKSIPASGVGGILYLEYLKACCAEVDIAWSCYCVALDFATGTGLDTPWLVWSRLCCTSVRLSVTDMQGGSTRATGLQLEVLYNGVRVQLPGCPLTETHLCSLEDFVVGRLQGCAPPSLAFAL